MKTYSSVTVLLIIFSIYLLPITVGQKEPPGSHRPHGEKGDSSSKILDFDLRDIKKLDEWLRQSAANDDGHGYVQVCGSKGKT